MGRVVLLRSFCLAVVLVWSIFSATAFAAPPRTISYQGYLADAGVPVNSTLDITFRLYDSETEPVPPLWHETQTVTVSNGVYQATLGSLAPLDLPFDRQYYLGVSVGLDPEMSPRQPLTSVPYAMKSITVETAPCIPGDILSCYSGPQETLGIGLCKAGTRTCGLAATFGACVGEVTPADHDACDGTDGNCNGVVNDACACIVGETITCGTGICLRRVTCTTGSEVCLPGAPDTELCDNGIDDDCDGQADEGCPLPDGSSCREDSECTSGTCSNGYCCSSRSGLCCATNADCSSLDQPAVCNPYTNCLPKKTVGICSSNVCQGALMDDPSACLGQTCSDATCTGTGNLTWTPKSICNENGICSLTGSVMDCNDANVCTSDICSPATGCSYPFNNTVTLSCYKDALGNPLGGTPGVGVCANGTQQCSNGTFGPCVGAVGPSYEVCGGVVDEDCDGQINEQDALGCTWFRFDNDSDGYGVDITRCYCTAGYSKVGAASDKFTAGNSGAFDCNDSTALAHPGMTETCDYSYDEDCDGSVNENNASNCLTRYLDNDRDGYGTTLSKCTCAPASPYDSQYPTDCNDSNASISPSKTEICNGVDDNCSGTVDTAEVPIVTLCPTMANATTSVCNGTSGCSPVCQTSWWDVDLTYSNGCEVQEDVYDRNGYGDSCPGYYAGNLNEYTTTPYSTDFTGNILPSTDSDYYYVNASDSSGNGTVRLDVRFISNTNSAFRYNVYNSTTCSTTLVSGQTAANLFTAPGYYVIRVYRYGGGASPLGETYQIRISNNVY